MKLPLSKRPLESLFLFGISLSFVPPANNAPQCGALLPKGEVREFRVQTLKLAEHSFGAVGRIFAGRFDIELLDDAVVDDRRIALTALAHAELGSVHGQAERFGEIAVAVGEHGD